MSDLIEPPVLNRQTLDAAVLESEDLDSEVLSPELQDPGADHPINNDRLDTDTETVITDTVQSRINALKESGASQFDPVQFHFIESLALRANQHNGDAKQLIEQRIAIALNNYHQELAAEEQLAQENLKWISEELSDSSDEIRQFFNNNHFKIVNRLAKKLARQRLREKPDRETLATLTRQLLRDNNLAHIETDQPSINDQLKRQENEAIELLTPDISTHEKLGELKSVRLFRESWTKINSNKVVDHAIKEGPEDSGPLNQENLAIRSLSTMRELSPQYMNRFIAYTDTILWLQKINDNNAAAKRKKNKKKLPRKPRAKNNSST